VLFIEELFDLLHEGQIHLRTSLDSGTAETFAKVHGVDCFDRVVENLSRYAESGGEISLKYIVLDGYNCNETDVVAFVEIAKKINADVDISCDNLRNSSNLTSDEKRTVSQLKDHCVRLGVRYEFDYLYDQPVE